MLGKRALMCFACGLAFTLAFGAVASASEISSAKTRETEVMVDGTYVQLSDPLISVSDGSHAKMYMPLRELLEKLGYTVEWDGANDAVKLTSPVRLDENVVTLTKKMDASLGYLNVPIADLGEDTHIKWRVAEKPEILVIKDTFKETEVGKGIRSFTGDFDRTLLEGISYVTFEQTFDGVPTGVKLICEINAAEIVTSCN